MSRNFYILFILLVCMQLVAKAQTTVTLFADSAVGKSRSIRAYAASNMSFQDDSILLKDERGSTAATNNFEHGYCVFNLAAAGIPAGATITSVSLGYYISSISGTSVAYGTYYVNGIVGDLSTNSDTLNMISILKHDKLSNGNVLYVSPGTVGFGTSAGYYTVNLNRDLSWLSNHAEGSISLVWAQRSTVGYFTRRYAIAGYTGVASTSTPHHRPYLTITYIAPSTCSGMPAGGNTVAMPSAGDATTYHSLSLSGGTEASGLSYQWQRSTTATGTYNNISGATNRTYSFSGVSATYYYRCAVSCGGSTNYSQPSPIFLIAANTCRNPIYVQRYNANYVTSFDNPMGQNAFNVTLWGDSSTYLVDSTVSTPMAYNNMVNAPSMQGLIFNRGYDHSIQVRSGYVGHNWTAWMDYNNNGTFEASENIGGMQDSVSEGVTNGSLSMVPLTLPDGYYRLRVVSDYLVLSPIACPTGYVRGMVRDYLVRVVGSVPVIRSAWSSANLGLVSRGIPSSAQGILVNGLALATDTGRLTMSVNAPFQISPNRATWSTSYTAPYASRTYTDTVFVRCNPTTTGVFTDTLSVSGGGYASTLKIPLRAESRDSCSGVPVAGVTQSSHDTANIFTTFVLSLNGSSAVTRLNYQWESSVTGTSGIWTRITGATNSSYEHHELERTTFFRCKVSCVSGSFVDSSTPVRVIWASGGARCIIADSVRSGCALTGMVIQKLRIDGLNGYLADSSRCNIYGYNDRSNLVLIVERGNQYTAQMTTGSSYSNSAQFWIDFNSNGTFESTETVGGRVNTRYVANCVLTIPATVNPGTYRMRLMTKYSSPVYPSINPCGSISFGSARDYTVIVNAGFRPHIKDFGLQVLDSIAKDSTMSFLATGLRPDSGYLRLRASANFGVSIADTVFRTEDSVFYRGGMVSLSRVTAHFRPRNAVAYTGTIRAFGGGLDSSVALNMAGIGVFTRCSGAASAGAISSSVLIADDTTNILIVGVGCDTNGGIESFWQQSIDSFTWLDITGSMGGDTLNFRGIMQKTYFRRAANCYFSRTTNYSNVVVVHYPHRIVSATIARTSDCYQYQLSMRVNSGLPSMRLIASYGDGTSDTLALSTATTYSWSHDYAMTGTYSIRFKLYKADTLYDSTLITQDVTFCNTVKIRNFFDSDSNCVKASLEPFTRHTNKVKIDSAGFTIDTLAYLGALNYSAYGPVGTIYRFTPIEDTAYWRILCAGSGYFADTLRSGAFMPSIHYVPLLNRSALYDFDVSSEARISRMRNGWICLYPRKLLGPDTLVANLKYRISPRMRISSAVPGPSSISTDSLEYTWNFNRFRSENIYVSLRHAIDFFTISDTLFSASQIGPISGDINVINNLNNRCDTVVASYDPNFIESDPSGCITSGIITEYTVGFENTGSDTAYNVHVLDTLSGYLDPRTLEPTMSSHPMVMETRHVAGMTIVKFDFPNIKLLDSSQPHGNHGLFKYKIRVRGGLADGTLISSRVGIYFDDNDVVMTNTQVNTINCPVYVTYPTVEATGGSRVLGTGILDADNLSMSDDVKIYPNPVTDELHIEASLMHYDQCIVTNTMGTVVHAFALQRNHQVVSTAKWPTGIYFVQLKGTSGSKTIKLLKQ